MERIIKPMTRNYPPLKLYLDDLEEIEDILKNLTDVSFNSTEFRFKNVAELSSKYHGITINNLTISTLFPRVWIRIGEGHTYMECRSSGNDNEASGNIFKTGWRINPVNPQTKILVYRKYLVDVNESHIYCCWVSDIRDH